MYIYYIIYIYIYIYICTDIFIHCINVVAICSPYKENNDDNKVGIICLKEVLPTKMFCYSIHTNHICSLDITTEIPYLYSCNMIREF